MFKAPQTALLSTLLGATVILAAAGKSITLMTVKLGRPIRVIKSRAQELHIALPGEDKNTKRWVG